MTDVRKLVKVKPLVWEDVREGIKCRDTSGLYVVRLAVAGRTSGYSLTRANRFVGDLFDTIADAMAAAEADHEARAYGDLIPATDGRAEGLREAAEICRAYRNARETTEDEAIGAMECAVSILARAAALPAWQPPPEGERPEGFECLGRNSYGIWRHVQWGKRNGWTVRGTFDHISPTAFWSLPPAPAQEGEP